MNKLAKSKKKGGDEMGDGKLNEEALNALRNQADHHQFSLDLYRDLRAFFESKLQEYDVTFGRKSQGDIDRNLLKLQLEVASSCAKGIEENLKELRWILAVNEQPERFNPSMDPGPFCDTCGYVTIRNGTCYKCLNCGNSMGPEDADKTSASNAP